MEAESKCAAEKGSGWRGRVGIVFFVERESHLVFHLRIGGERRLCYSCSWGGGYTMEGMNFFQIVTQRFWYDHCFDIDKSSRRTIKREMAQYCVPVPANG